MCRCQYLCRDLCSRAAVMSELPKATAPGPVARAPQRRLGMDIGLSMPFRLASQLPILPAACKLALGPYGSHGSAEGAAQAFSYGPVTQCAGVYTCGETCAFTCGAATQCGGVYTCADTCAYTCDPGCNPTYYGQNCYGHAQAKPPGC